MYNPSLHSSLNKPIGITGIPVDARYYYYDEPTFTYREYGSEAEVLTYLVGEDRTGATVKIGDQEWWFRDGIGDGDLTPKFVLPENTATKSELQVEAVDREDADTQLQINIDSETQNRITSLAGKSDKSELDHVITIGYADLDEATRKIYTNLAFANRPVVVLVDKSKANPESGVDYTGFNGDGQLIFTEAKTVGWFANIAASFGNNANYVTKDEYGSKHYGFFGAGETFVINSRTQANASIDASSTFSQTIDAGAIGRRFRQTAISANYHMISSAAVPIAWSGLGIASVEGKELNGEISDELGIAIGSTVLTERTVFYTYRSTGAVLKWNFNNAAGAVTIIRNSNALYTYGDNDVIKIEVIRNRENVIIITYKNGAAAPSYVDTEFPPETGLVYIACVGNNQFQVRVNTEAYQRLPTLQDEDTFTVLDNRIDSEVADIDEQITEVRDLLLEYFDFTSVAIGDYTINTKTVSSQTISTDDYGLKVVFAGDTGPLLSVNHADLNTFVALEDGAKIGMRIRPNDNPTSQNVGFGFGNPGFTQGNATYVIWAKNGALSLFDGNPSNQFTTIRIAADGADWALGSIIEIEATVYPSQNIAVFRTKVNGEYDAGSVEVTVLNWSNFILLYRSNSSTSTKLIRYVSSSASRGGVDEGLSLGTNEIVAQDGHLILVDANGLYRTLPPGESMGQILSFNGEATSRFVGIEGGKITDIYCPASRGSVEPIGYTPGVGFVTFHRPPGGTPGLSFSFFRITS